ncbi:MAG: phage terminase small subunit P27 family [Clostridia bacterium]|nr:phage terminase small subunit P27 family [Clostridia bacterium]
MARPAKATGARSRHETKEETNSRREIENAIRGEGSGPVPPQHLTKEQKKIFRSVVRELKASDMLGSLDAYILATFAIAVDRMTYIETEINADPQKIANDRLMKAKDKYTKDFYRCCTELCLSPQSRAKYSSAKMAADKGPSALMLALNSDAG